MYFPSPWLSVADSFFNSLIYFDVSLPVVMLTG